MNSPVPIGIGINPGNKMKCEKTGHGSHIIKVMTIYGRKAEYQNNEIK